MCLSIKIYLFRPIRKLEKKQKLWNWTTVVGHQIDECNGKIKQERSREDSNICYFKHGVENKAFILLPRSLYPVLHTLRPCNLKSPTWDFCWRKIQQKELQHAAICCPAKDLSLRACSVMSNSWWPRGLWSLPGSSVHRIPQARILEWVAISSSREIFPTQILNLHLLWLLPWQVSSWTKTQTFQPLKAGGALPIQKPHFLSVG